MRSAAERLKEFAPWQPRTPASPRYFGVVASEAVDALFLVFLAAAL